MARPLDINTAMKKISDYISSNFDIEFDSEQTTVSRVDYCYNFQLNETDVINYLSGIEHASLPTKTRTVYKGQTVAQENGSHKWSVYNKYEETKSLYEKGKASAQTLEQSKGILRLEVRYKKSSACRRLAKQLRLPRNSPEWLFTQDVAEYCLQGALNRLGLASEINSLDSRVYQIVDYFGRSIKTEKLVGFICLNDFLGKEGAKSHYKMGTWKRRQSALIEAGVNAD